MSSHVRSSMYSNSSGHDLGHIALFAMIKNNLRGLNRGSYTSAHVLLNLLKKLGKRGKMRDLPSNLSLFRNEFNKFNNAKAQMLNSINVRFYLSYDIKITLKSHF